MGSEEGVNAHHDLSVENCCQYVRQSRHFGVHYLEKDLLHHHDSANSCDDANISVDM